MAGSFFGFDTTLSNIDDDEAAGGPSEDEYDALNDETFGHDDVFDWEVEHEQLAEQLESSRHHNQSSYDNSHSQLEASLSRMVLDELDSSSNALNLSVWRNDAPFPSAPPPIIPSMKTVCTVEEIERQMRQSQMSNTAAAAPPSHTYFQPTVILQRPPGMPSAGMQSAGMQNAGMQNAGMQNAGMQNTSMQSAGQMQYPQHPQHNNIMSMFNTMNQNSQMEQNNQRAQNNQMGQMNNHMQQYPNQYNNQNMNIQGPRPRGYQMMPDQNMMYDQNMMSNYGQAASNQATNQYPPMMNQQRMMHPPPRLNAQRPNFGQAVGAYNQNYRNMMSNYGQTATNQSTNQYPPMTNQRGIMHPPPRLNAQSPNFGQAVGAYNQNYRNMMSNYGQTATNQYPPLMNQRVMMHPPAILNAQRPNFGQAVDAYNQNYRNMMSNYGQTATNQSTNQYPPMTNQRGIMHPPPRLNAQSPNFGQAVGAYNQNYRNMMSNYGQTATNQATNQYPPLMNQRVMMHPPAILNAQRPNFGQAVDAYNQNYRGAQQMQGKMDHHSMSQSNLNHSDQSKHSPPKMQRSRTYSNSNQRMTSQNLVQMIQHNHPMLQYNNQHYHNNPYPGMGRNPYHSHPMMGHHHHHGHEQRHNGYYGNYHHRPMSRGEELYYGNGQAEDEYAGLMTQREKQWLLNIQMMQLNTGPPYVNDFYFTVFNDRKTNKRREPVMEAHKANQQNHPLYARAGAKQEQSPRMRHNPNRHNSIGEDSPRTYVPTQFENSLGRLQCGSVTAPRKIIDVEVMQNECGAAAQPAAVNRAPSVASTAYRSETPREPRRTKYLLLELETLYIYLLKLDELHDPLAIATAILIKEREQKAQEQLEAEAAEQQQEETNMFLRNIEAVSKRMKENTAKDAEKRQGQGASGGMPRQEDKDDLIAAVFKVLMQDDRIKQFIMIKKGRALLVRFLEYVPPTHPNLRTTWSRILRSLPAASRRNPSSLNDLAMSYSRYIQNSTGWSAVMESFSLLKEAVDPARSPYVLTAPFTLSCVCALIEKATELVNTPEATSQERQWTKFLKTLARALKTTTLTVARPERPLPEDRLVFHLRQLESRNIIEILQRGQIVEFADVSRADMLEQLTKYLC